MGNLIFCAVPGAKLLYELFIFYIFEDINVPFSVGTAPHNSRLVFDMDPRCHYNMEKSKMFCVSHLKKKDTNIQDLLT